MNYQNMSTSRLGWRHKSSFSLLCLVSTLLIISLVGGYRVSGFVESVVSLCNLIIEYLAEDSVHWLGIIAMPLAVYGSYLVACNKKLLEAQVLYLLSNVLLIYVFYSGQDWHVIHGPILFLLTSIRGCITYWPRSTHPLLTQ